MGFYIQAPVLKHKAQYIVSEYDGKIVPQPKTWAEVPADKAIICVVDNGPFEAAGFAYSEKEFKTFSAPDDPRKKVWMIMNRNKAIELTGYKEKG